MEVIESAILMLSEVEQLANIQFNKLKAKVLFDLKTVTKPF